MSSAAAQLDFPTIEAGWEIVTVDADRKAGRFTAALIARNQEKLEAVVEALAQGMSIRRIARAYEISVNTVLTVKRIHGAKIETEKQRLGVACFDVARMAVERIRDEMDDMPKASLPIIAGIMTDKGLLLTGAPTVRIEHTSGPTVRSVAEYIDSLPVAAPVCTEEHSPQKGALLLGESGQSVDSGSTVSSAAVEVSAENGPEVGQNAPKKGPAGP